MSEAYDGATCVHCGSAWFTINPGPNDEGPIIGVCLDRHGHITGFTGVLCCIECDEPWERRPELRLVTDG